MIQKPSILIQIVHINGPLKGQIQEFGGDQVTVGRHPDCDVVFPKDLTLISRRHAKIKRDGNRFSLVDESTNGTFVNGKPVNEVRLRSGDVITVGEGGPKISFLTQVGKEPAVSPPPRQSVDKRAKPEPEPQPAPMSSARWPPSHHHGCWIPRLASRPEGAVAGEPAPPPAPQRSRRPAEWPTHRCPSRTAG